MPFLSIKLPIPLAKVNLLQEWGSKVRNNLSHSFSYRGTLAEEVRLRQSVRMTELLMNAIEVENAKERAITG
jgi:hypothetical protein